MAKRTIIESPSIELLRLLDEVGLAVRECLEQMLQSRNKMKAPLEKDVGSGIIPGK